MNRPPRASGETDRMDNASGKVERLYELLVDDQDGRVCKDIPEAACRDVPGNFFRIGLAQTCSKLADEMSNAKTVLPWLLGAVGASPNWIGFLVPVRESLSMLPQLAIASAVRRIPRRKFAYATGAVVQAIALAGMATAVLVLDGNLAAAAVLTMLVLFSLARGICSVASKDVVGKTIPKTRRGRLSGYTVAVAGLLTIGVAAVLTTQVRDSESVMPFVMLLGAATGLWCGAALIFASIREVAGATEGGVNAMKEALQRLSLLRTDSQLRHFITVRALLISTALAGPYYVLLARKATGGGQLGLFVAASGLASVLSSPFWGRYADRSSRRVLLLAAGVASVLGVVVAAVAWSGVPATIMAYIAAGAFFLLSIAHSGVRVGRKTYLIDMAGGDRRIDYVAVSNSVIGVILLTAGLTGLLAPWIQPAGMLLLYSAFGLVGIAIGFGLPEVE